jgi:hypothetical protein
VAELVIKYHDEHAQSGRLFRFVLGAYPAITKTDVDAETLPAEPTKELEP